MLLQEKPLPPPPASPSPRNAAGMERYAAHLAVALSLAALLAMCLHWWHAGYVIAQGDNPPLIAPWVWFVKALGAWSDYGAYFGQLDGSFTFVPFMLVWWTADHLFGGSLGQIATHYLIVAAAWSGAYRLARTLGVRVWPAAVAAWLYTINPFTQMVFGPTLTEGMFFGIIAWSGVWLALAATAREKRARARLWLSILAFAAMPVLGPTPSLVFQMALGVLVLIGAFTLLAPDRREFLRWSAWSALFMIAASLWWVVPDAVSFVGVTIPHPTALNDLSWTYARSSLLNNLRFLYTWLWLYPEYYPFATAYDANVLTYAGGFFAVAAAAFGLIVLRGARLALCRYALAVALVVMFISKGTHPPLEWINSAFASVPGAFLAYADPGGEVALALLLLCAAAAMMLDRVKPVALAASFAAVALSGIYLLSGAVFHGTVLSSNGRLMPSQYVKIPAYWIAAANYVNGASGRGGVLLLPPHLSPGYDVEYDFGYYGIDSVATNLISRRLLYLDAGLQAGLGYLKHVQSQELADRLRDLLAVRSPLAVPMMQELGIRYVVYRADIVHTQHEWFSQNEIGSLLGREPVRFGPLAVYDLGSAESTFSLHREWIAGGYGTASAGDMAELGALEEPFPRVDIASVPAQFPGRPALIEQSTAVVDGADDARPAGGSQAGVDRAVRFATDDGLRRIRVVAKAQTARELRMSLGRASARVDVANFPLSALHQRSERGLALLTSRTAAFDERGARVVMRQIVQNFNAQAVWADVLVQVPEQPRRVYSLTVQNTRYEADAQHAAGGIILRFAHVLIPQGETAFGLFGRRPANADRSAIAPGDAHAPGMPYSFAFASLRPTADTATDPVSVLGAVSLGSATLGFTGRDHAALALMPAPSQAPSLTAIVTFAQGANRYRCPAELYANQPEALDYLVGSCLRQNALPVDLDALRMLSVELIARGDRNDLQHLQSALAGARLAETAEQGDLAALPAVPGAVETHAHVIHLTHEGDLTGALIEPPAAGAAPSTGAYVSAQIAGRTVKGFVAPSRGGGLAVEEADHTVDWIPAGSSEPLTITGYRMPVTVSWNVREPARDPIVNVRVAGCAAGAGGSVALTAVVGSSRRVYQQDLVPAADGSGFAAVVNTLQAFPGANARITGVSATCAADLPTGARQTVDAQMAMLQRRTSAPVLLVKNLRPTRTPAAMHLRDLPLQASVAAAGAPPQAVRPPDLDCDTHGVHCGMGGIRAAIPPGFAGLATFNRLYDRSWLAVELGHGIAFPKHVRADGWRNAWYLSQGGELVVLNLMNVFTVAGLLLGFGIIVWQLQYKRS